MRFTNNKWFIGLAVIVVAVLALGLVMKRNHDIASLQTPKTQSVAVQVATVTRGSLPITQHYMGKVEPVLATDLAARITANVIAVNKREGDLVIKGETLLQLDELALSSKVRAMEAEVSAAESLTAAAQSSYQTQLASFERDEYLYSSKAISLENFEKSKAAADNALSQLNAAKQRVRQAQANLSTVQTELGYAYITAPFDGIVVKRSAEPGEIAAPGKSLLRLQGTSAGYRIIAQISQEQIGRIKVGTMAIITDGPNQLEAPVSKVYPALAANNLATIEVVIDKLPSGLPAGATVGLDFVLDNVIGCIVPVNALVKTNETTFVVVVKDGMAEQVPVIVTGQTDKLAVVSGILEDAVVAVGQQSALLRLMNGVKVKTMQIAGDNP
ncbi:MAG: efflux RND transporter periplasmic adaptor subunit [Pelosinus sp.]|nr:efflux RND transporter periplasmic adaptor subunit [Pelosinus sp.]